MASPRQIEANRRNAQKSTGPRTPEGKARSRFNGVTHGMTAKFDVLPGEDGAALTGRIDAWTADFQPRNQLERDLVERAARLSWKLERVERAHVDRLMANILKATSGENEAVENEVLTMGERLFQDLTKPHGFSPGIVVDPSNPTMLVLRLESSAPGCRWLLDRWADLRSLLEQEQPWQSHDKLRAIRLLGRQPLDALDDSQVAKVFLACHKIDSSGGELLHEIWNELRPDERHVARQRFAGRRLEWLPLRDRTEAREALLQIVDRAVSRLATKADVHRRRAERDVASAPSRLAFDDSMEGERLRNYESSCNRALTRTIDTLFKVCKASIKGKFVPAAAEVESSTPSVAPSDQRITQTKPDSASINDAVSDSVATVDQGIPQTKPNSVSHSNTEKFNCTDNDKAKAPFREDGQPRSSPRRRCRPSRLGRRARPLSPTRPTRAFGAGLRSRPGSRPRDRPKRRSPCSLRGAVGIPRCLETGTGKGAPGRRRVSVRL
jgi:hypothetical protein